MRGSLHRGTFFYALLATVLIGMLAVVGATAQAEGVERITRYDIVIKIEDDGALLVQETIDYDFGVDAVDRHGIYRDIPVEFYYNDDFQRLTPLEWLEVGGSPGTPVQWKRENSGDSERVRIGDPDTTVTGVHTYTISYRIEGTLNGFEDQDELYWNATGTEWGADINAVTVRVEAPGNVLGVACYAGYAEFDLPCTEARKEGKVATFAAEGLTPYQGITVVVGIPKGLVPDSRPILEENWKLEKAFAITPVTTTLSGIVLAGVLGAIGRMFWKWGRDRRYAGGAVEAAFGRKGDAVETVPIFGRTPTPVEFAPPEGLRPGQMGTLVDEIANPLDVTATLVDLATRGYLQIEEIEKGRRWSKPDWLLRKQKDTVDGLKKYEALLLDRLFDGEKEVQLSALKREFAERLKEVQDALYDNVVAEGWFAVRPDRARRKWRLIGLGVVLSGSLVVLMTALVANVALVTVPLPLGGLLLMIGGGRMPRKTAKGSGVMRRTLGFRRFIETAETRSAEFAERKNLFTEYLAYAVVFGCTDKWAKAFAGLAEEPGMYGTWYVGGSTLHAASLAVALDSFSTASSSAIGAAAASSGGSGFSGGSVGGGFDGGGGGSW